MDDTTNNGVPAGDTPVEPTPAAEPMMEPTPAEDVPAEGGEETPAV